MTATTLQKELRGLADSEKKIGLQRFFKTGKGQYAEGDIFIGVMVPQIRALAKKYSSLALPEVVKLVHSKFHEERLLGLIIWTLQFKDALKLNDRQKQKVIYSHYLKNRKNINNWDLVDVTTPGIVGEYCFRNRAEEKTLRRLVRSKSLWERRIAVLATFTYIREEEFALTSEFAETLLNDSEDLIHKATGWMLREAGKRNQAFLVKFLERNCTKMPRTMLRYAIEKFPESVRKSYLNR